MRPSEAALVEALGVIFAASGAVEVTGRAAELHASSFDCEIISCRVAGDAEVKIFAKYQGKGGPGQTAHLANGHRGGVAREAKMYRDLLSGHPGTAARYLGSIIDEANSAWLFLEYLDESQRMSKTSDPGGAAVAAARWIAQFHETYPSTVEQSNAPFLGRFDSESVLGWTERARSFTASFHDDHPWIRQLCDSAADWTSELVEGPQSLIHGEFYPANILSKHGLIYPVDWESASIGPGEIDVATLTEGWPTEIAQLCESAYIELRADTLDPNAIRRRLGLARLLVGLMWLGDTQTQAAQVPRWLSELMVRQAERSGLL